MSLSAELRREVSDLLAALLERQIDAAGMARLDKLVSTDAEVRHLYLNYVNLCATLRWSHQEQDAPELDVPQIRPASHGQVPSPFPLIHDSALVSQPILGGVLSSYLIATVMLGVGLLIGTLVHVSEPGRESRQFTLPSPSGRGAGGEGSGSGLSPLHPIVGRITGMVDCKWSVVSGQWSESTSHQPLATGHLIHLGDKYALSSGLMEITYDTGAKVILEGPVTYEVESSASGFLSVGKLTARVEKKDEGRTRNEEVSAASRSSFLIPHSYFAVRTPTATVTDLGTEFGVEVAKSGETTSHVFRGSVKVAVAAIDGKAEGVSQILHENESVCVEKNEGRCAIVVGASVKPANFVRKLVKLTIKTFDLVDVVAGGDGFSGRRGRGIDPTTGRIVDTPLKDPVDVFLTGDGGYHRVEAMPFVDGVFIPDGRTSPVQVDSAGHTFAEFGNAEHLTGMYIWAGGAVPMPPTQKPVRTDLDDIDYSLPGHGLLMLHANNGITFDLQTIRRANPGQRLTQFRTVAGNAETYSEQGLPFYADAWVLVDGCVRWRHREINRYNVAFPIAFSLDENDRFLTLVSTDGGNGISGDLIMFGDPRLELLPATTTVEKGGASTSK